MNFLPLGDKRFIGLSQADSKRPRKLHCCEAAKDKEVKTETPLFLMWGFANKPINPS